MSASRMKTKLPAWKHVVITGAAQGLGRALSELCASARIRVSMLDSNDNELSKSCAQINGDGGLVKAVTCDVSCDEAVRRAFEQLRSSNGPADAVICCAAIGDSEYKQQFSAARLQRVLDVNLMGIAHCMEHCLPDMHAFGGGSFVMISSLLDARGYAGTASYSVSKAALRSLSDSARVLLQSSGINVVLVRPGFMRTAMTAQNAISMPGMFSADEAARRILHGIARGKSVIAFPRWLTVFAEAARLFPRPLFDRIVRSAMIKDCEEDALHYNPKAHGGAAHDIA